MPASTAPGRHLLTVVGRATSASTLLPAFVHRHRRPARTARTSTATASPTTATATRLDGPKADVDGDGVTNDARQLPARRQPGADRQPTRDYEGDACDPDQGADRAATTFRNARHARPGDRRAVPRNVAARAEGGGRAVVTWDAARGRRAVTGYRVTRGRP